MEGNVMHDQERGSFYASLADGEYRLADIPALTEKWLTGLAPAAEPTNDGAAVLTRSGTPAVSLPPPGAMSIQDVSVIVSGGKLTAIRVGDSEPTTSFTRSRDFEHKWTDTESESDITAPGA
jgi:hypothetical protein